MPKGTSWTAKELRVLRKYFPLEGKAGVAHRTGRTASGVKQMAKKLALQGPENRHFLTEWDQAWLIALYPHVKSELIAEALSMSLRRLYGYAKNLKLRKTAEYLASPDACSLRRDHPTGVWHRFKKGHVPKNKGIKGWQAGGRAHTTQFKKGQECRNKAPIGTISYSQDGLPRRKIADPNVWEFCHRAEWTKAHGPVPRGHVVSFKDGDRTNWSLENLELLTFAQNLEKMRQRMLAQYGPELIATKKALTRLKGYINEPTDSRPARRNRRSQKRTLCDAARRQGQEH